MKVRILGCGTSTGVPKIGNDWGACDPNEPRNLRLRSAILVESAGERLVVDCGPDLRQQLLAAEVGTLAGVLITHDHGDHVHGIDDLRPVSQMIGGPVPLHARAEVIDGLQRRFSYAFECSNFYPAVVEPHQLGPVLSIGTATMRWVIQPHGSTTSLGLRFDEDGRSLAYSTDFSDLTDDMAALYRGVDVWITDCLT
ncbi:MBL fold metallo-hydrolase, partial [Sphingomonas sp.]|uniref:MBL fold metallo-hydrolase n=1 Tax=Sphingomonas sp. TaxID=28214 RepID=UPI0025EF4F53